jgi:hypothetical protein
MRVVFAAAALGLAACSHAQTQTTTLPNESQTINLRNGQQAQEVRCDGTHQDYDSCYAKAGEVCPRGYDIVDSNSDIEHARRSLIVICF